MDADTTIPGFPPGLDQRIENMVRRQMYIDVETDKVLQYAQMRKCLLYWSGKQWLKPVVDPNTGNIIDYAEIPLTAAATPFGPETQGIRGRYDTIENFVRADGNTFCAVLGEKSPNPKAQALDSASPDADARAKLADRILVALRRMWNVEEVHRLLTLSAWRDGTFFLYTPWEEDSEKYGFVTRQEQSTTEQRSIFYRCQNCGSPQWRPAPEGLPPGQLPPSPPCENCKQPMLVPEQDQTVQVPVLTERRVPGSAPGLYDRSFYEVTMPFYVTVLQFERTPWFIEEEEVHRGELLEKYPILMDKINGNVEQSEWPDQSISQIGYWTRNMRANTSTDLRQTSRYRWIRSRIWMRATQYNMFGNEMMDLGGGQEVLVREWFKTNFPGGCRITRVGRWIVDIQPEVVSWHWSVGTPMVSKNVFCDPIVWDFLQIQDAVNSADNLFQENMERNLPLTLMDQNKVNIDALRSRAGSPGEILPVEVEGGSLKDAAYNLPTPQLDGQNFGYRDKMLETGRELTGITKAIFGASNASTAHEAELQKTQALLKLGVVWKGLQSCWRGAYTNGLRLLAKFGADVLIRWGLSPDDANEASTLIDDFGNLNGIRVAVEEGIPATWGQIRDAIMFIMEKGPPAWTLTGLDHPSNAPNLQDALGIGQWMTPGGNAKDYVLKLIKRLLANQINPNVDPMGNPMMAPDGMPMPPTPSENIDPMILPVGMGMPLFQEWFLSDDGQQAAQNQPEGYANLHLAVQIYSTPPPMPGGPEGDQGQSAPGGPNPSPTPGHSPGVGPTAPGPVNQAQSEPGRLQVVSNMGRR